VVVPGVVLCVLGVVVVTLPLELGMLCCPEADVCATAKPIITRKLANVRESVRIFLLTSP
jgi:hypothetical protein